MHCIPFHSIGRYTLSFNNQPSDEKVKKALMDNVHDTEAYVAARDDLLIVAFRGTQQKADWVTSFSFSQTDAPDEWNLGTSKLEIHQARNFCYLLEP